MLPAYPWSERPQNHPLTADEVCAALYEAEGDVTAASVRLKVGSLILRKFIERSSRARAAVREMDNRLGDKARSKLAQALDSSDDRRADWAIRYVLNAKANRHLGYAAHADADDLRAQNLNGQPIVNINLQPAMWGDGTIISAPPQSQPPKTIELHPSSLPQASEKDPE